MFRKINSILNKKEKTSLVGIFFMMLISAFLDLIGVSAILPVVSLLSSGSIAIANNQFLKTLSDIIGSTEVNNLFVASLVVLIILVFIKCAYGLLYTYLVNKFTMNYSRKLTNKLMNAYLAMPYEFHLENNSSTLMRKSIYDVECFVEAIRGLLNLMVVSVTILVIAVYLFVVSWVISLIVGALLLVVSLLIIFILKPKTRKLSKSIQELNSNNYKYLSQAFNGIKESKISHTEKTFSDIYDENREKIVKDVLKRNMINAIPSELIEFIGILGICLSLAIIKISGESSDVQIIEMFTLFVYAIIRLLPLVINTTSIINAFSFYKTSVDAIYLDLNSIKEVDIENGGKVEPIPFETIEAKNIKFAYKNMPEKVILDGVNLEIKKNTSVAISGPSGCGKTTLIDIVIGLLFPQEGEVLVDGKNINENLVGWRSNISYIPQSIFIADDTIRNNVAFGVKKENIEDLEVFEALKKAELDEFVRSLPEGLDTVVGERGVRLSGGQRQRIGIARAFFRNTNIIVFDEATNALDYQVEENILDNVFSYSKDHTLIVISHRSNTVEKCENIYEINDHQIKKVK